jgi:hypothetical protein
LRNDGAQNCHLCRPSLAIAIALNNFVITFTIFQRDDGTLVGSASTAGLSAPDGTCTGMVTDRSFVFTVPWTPGDSIGEYSGTFNLEDRLVGFTVDKNHLSNVAAWASKRLFLLSVLDGSWS